MKRPPFQFGKEAFLIFTPTLGLPRQGGGDWEGKKVFKVNRLEHEHELDTEGPCITPISTQITAVIKLSRIIEVVVRKLRPDAKPFGDADR
ncbi:MAG: hypothetical protein JSW56_15420, partial [Deltaproteobacteria bacterium]